MKKLLSTGLALMLFGATASASITTTFSNPGGQITNSANWSSGLPVGQQGGISVNAGYDTGGPALVDYDVVHSAETVSRDGGLSSLAVGSGSTWLANGTAAYSGFRGINVSAGGSYTQEAGVDGDFTNNSRDSFVQGAGSSIVINGGDFKVGRDLILNTGGAFTVNGGTVSVAAEFYTQSFSSSAGAITFNGGVTTAGALDFDKATTLTFGGAIAGSFTTTGYSALSAATVSFDWLTGTKMELTMSGEDEWAAANWAAGTLTYNGADYTTLGDWSTVTTAGGLGGGANFVYDSNTETLSVIPEPATIGLLASAGALLLVFQRRKNR